MWTGGQYSLYRIIFGIYLLVHFSGLLPWATELFSNRGVLADATSSPFIALFPNAFLIQDAPWVAISLVLLAIIAAIFFTVGRFDRLAAVVLWFVLASLFGRNPLISNPSLPFVGWLLLAHCFVPKAPYGSLAAYNRNDPDNGWELPRLLWGAAWILMAVGYSYSGFTKLDSPSWMDGSALQAVLNNPLARDSALVQLLASLPAILLKLMTWGGLALELLFAPLALLRKVRPWIWLAMLMMHLGLILLIDFADLSFGMVVLHLFTFNPNWVSCITSKTRDLMFYDGSCGLCHRAVRFVLAEDHAHCFDLAPLQSDTFKKAVSKAQRQQLPDSIVIVKEDGELLVESDAILHVGKRIGGYWRVLAMIAAIVPKFIRDACYRFIASIRLKLFSRPKDVCPIMPKRLRSRFIL